MANGAPTDDPADALAHSYDQSFVILGLATWGRLHPSPETHQDLEACWSATNTHLHDPDTGMMLEHNGLSNPRAPDAPCPAQNPHMHLYEAALQAFQMTGNRVWLDRAAAMRAKGLAYFFDDTTGTIVEFIAPDLSPLPGRNGQRREIGHQCEWAWLLMREADLGGDPAMRKIAARLLEFADAHGFAKTGPMKGGAYDAVSCDTDWREDRFLLWPQTEAIKTYAVRAQTPNIAEQARALTQLVFEGYFAGHAAFANQLDHNGHVIWADGISRWHYHVVLAMTEGARAGLWPNPV